MNTSKLGWIKLHRQLMHSDVWQDSDLLKFWLWVLLKANHKRGSVVIRGETIRPKPGQFVCGRRGAAKETGLSVQTVRTSMETLVRLGNITVKPTRRFSLVTVTHWREYQGVLDPLETSDLETPKPPTDQPTDQPTDLTESNPLIIDPDGSKKGEKQGSGGDGPPTDLAESNPPINPLINHEQEVQEVQEVQKQKKAVGGNGNGKTATALTWPAVLNTPEFRKAWDEYLRYRKEKNASPYKPIGLKHRIASFEKWADRYGVAAVIEQIHHTIANNYTGIFEPKPDQGRRPAARGAPADAVDRAINRVVEKTNAAR